MALASIVDPNWQDPNTAPPANPYALSNLAPPPPSVEQAPPPVQAPMAAPPVGVGYTPSAAPAGGVPAPPALNTMAPAEAWRLAAQTGGARPAGFTPTTRNESVEGRAASPELEQAVGDKLGADANASLAQANADTAVADARGQADQRLAAFDDAQRHDAEARAQATQAKLAYDRDHMSQLMQDATKAQPSAAAQYWGDKSAFGKVATGIAMALKGFVFGATGRGDPAEWLNEQIKQTAMDQQSKAAKSREAVGDASSLYGMNKQALGDDERAKLATELTLRQQVLSTLDRKVAEAASDPLAQLRAAQLRKTLADQNAATLEDFWNKTADKHTSAQAEAYHGATGGQPDILQRLKRANEIKGGFETLTNDTGAVEKSQGIQKGELENRKLVADTTKSEAEAAAAAGKDNAGAALGNANVESTAYNPARLFQGTDARAATIGQAGYNATLQAVATKMYGARGARDIIEKLKIEEGDTAATIAMKRQQAAKLFGAQGASAIPGFVGGAIPDEGEP